MASNKEESSEMPELYQCQVCLEDMSNSNPRLLKCHHSFCSKCLQLIDTHGKIQCPVCRKITRTADGDVMSLPLNFYVLKMKDAEKKIMADQSKKCQMCHINKAISICKSCKQMMCSHCSTKHASIQQFESHRTYMLCQKHFESVTHLCQRCVARVCLKCMVNEHSDHSEEFVDITDGISRCRKNMSEVISKIGDNLQNIRTQIQENDSEVAKTRDLKKSLLHKRSQLEKQLSKIVAVLEDINENYASKEDDVRYAFTEAWETLKSLLSSDMSQESDEVFILRYSKRKALTEKLLTDTIHMKKTSKYTAPPYAITECNSGELVINTMKTNYPESPQPGTSGAPKKALENPTLCWDITGTVLLKDPVEIASLPNEVGGAVVADHLANCIWVFNKQGDFVGRIDAQPGQCGRVMGVTVGQHVRRMFIVQQYCLTCINLADVNSPMELIKLSQEDNRRKVYKPKVDNIAKMAIVNLSTIVITDKCQGSMFEFNLLTEQTKSLPHKWLEGPTYISVSSKTAGGLQYLVTLRDLDEVHIYNSNWQLVETIVGGLGPGDGQLHMPQATAVLANSDILVADWKNDRVSRFSPSGVFLGHLLTERDGIQRPKGLTFNDPYLWVTESYLKHASVKRYKVFERDILSPQPKKKAKLNHQILEYSDESDDDSRAALDEEKPSATSV